MNYEIKQLNNKFKDVVRIQLDKYPNNKPNYLFLNEEPELLKTKDENILQSILIGYSTNVIFFYIIINIITVFQKILQMLIYLKNSLFNYIKSATKYAVLWRI